MENIRRSKQIALDLIEDTKDVIESGALSPVASQVRTKGTPNEELTSASTSREKSGKPSEYIKYGKITFNTTAILHHYPQIQNGRVANCALRKPPAKRPDLNANDDAVRTEIEETKITVDQAKDNDNNNDCTINDTGDAAKDDSKQPVKFAEEKLV